MSHQDGTLCPACGFANAPGIKFCGECGRRLVATPAAPTGTRPDTPPHLARKILAARSALHDERKLVTVLFADVKGSMELAEQVDAEEWHKILERFFVILAAGVHRFEGTVTQYTGDGIMALFGAPIAHEDHAQRACWAALHLAEELRRNAQDLRRERGLDFAVRMGLNSGEVVVGTIGDDLHMDYTALGHTVGLAQRVEQTAAADRVYLTEHTARLVAGYFQLEDLGPFNLKGVREPVRVYELRGPAARTRLEAIGRRRGFSSFVGRERETAALDDALARALEGQGQVVGIAGEAGVGKSRLCEEFVERCRARGVRVHRAHGLPHGKTMPLLPILEMMRGYFGVSAQDSDEEARRKVAGSLLLLDRDLTDDVALLLEFLGIPDPVRPASRMDPDARQRRLLSLVQRLVHARSRREPTVLLLEDLHWFDEASESFVGAIAAAVPGTRTLLVLNYRPEFRAPWTEALDAERIRLSPLGPEATAALLRDLLGGHPSVTALHDRIHERTAGNPFFVEEVVQSLVESGALAGTRGGYRLERPMTEVTIPPTVQALLAARIDRLPERERLVLQTAAVVGKEFPGSLLGRVAELPEEELATVLSALTAAELVYQEALHPEPSWAFRHPLTQEVAYRSQLGDRRARVHAAVARAMAELWPERLDEDAALLAYHWETAGDRLEAARWSRRAADWVGARNLAAAVGHWRKVRALLAGVPESEETRILGLLARTRILGLSWTLGMPAEEAATLVAEGKDLASRGGDVQSRALLLGMAQLTRRMYGGFVPDHLDDAVEAVRLADQSPDLAVRLALRVNLIASFYEAGRLATAVRHTDEALALRPDDLMLGAHLSSVSPYIWFVMFRGLLLEAMGRLDDAGRELGRALDLARAHQDTEVIAQTEWCLATLAHTRGDGELALRHAQQAVDTAERIGSAFGRVLAYQVLGQAQLLLGDASAALRASEYALAVGQERSTARQQEADILASHAEALAAAGRHEAARETAERAVASGRDRGTMMWECAANLALARVLLSDPDGTARDAIDAALERALHLAGETGAAKYTPFVHVERARLARALGDERAAREALQAAHRLFVEIGALPRAARIARELA